MVIPRRHRHHTPDKENLQFQRESRPWDNDIARLKPPAPPPPEISVSDRLLQFDKPVPPPSRESNPLNAFLALPHPQAHSTTPPESPPPAPASPPAPTPPAPPAVPIQLGNRQVKPLLTAPNPPPLAGLPVPVPPARPRSTSSKPIHPSHSKAAQIASQVPLPPPPAPEMPDLDPSPHTSRRYSVRHSVRVPSVHMEQSHGGPHVHPSGPPVKPLPAIPDPDQIDLLPDSTSFLDFNDDHRLNPIPPPHSAAPAATQARASHSFCDADSFDTFDSIPTPVQLTSEPSAAPHSSTDGQALNVQAHPSLRSERDEEDGGLDVPANMSASPAASRAMRDLQRASITAANELANSIRLMSQQPSTVVANPTERVNSSPSRRPSSPHEDASKLQGQVLLRSRIFRRWNLRYATIVNQAYFGPVLLLFRPNNKPIINAAFALKSSKMVALAQSTISLHDAARRHNGSEIHLFEITTSQRTYTFACTDAHMRSQWYNTLKGSHHPM